MAVTSQQESSRIGQKLKGYCECSISPTPHPQASGIVERTNGLLKWFLRPQDPKVPDQLWDTVTKVSDPWRISGCPWLTYSILSHDTYHAFQKQKDWWSPEPHKFSWSASTGRPPNYQGSPAGLKDPPEHACIGNQRCPWQRTQN